MHDGNDIKQRLLQGKKGDLSGGKRMARNVAARRAIVLMAPLSLTPVKLKLMNLVATSWTQRPGE